MSWFVILSIIAVLWVVAICVLSGPDLRQFDQPIGEHFDNHPDDAEVTNRLLAVIGDLRKNIIAGRSIKQGLSQVREFADNLSADLETETTFKAVSIHGVNAEWAVSPGADPQRRTLFFHGGAFLFGSPKGHRKMSDKLSKLTGGAVLSVDYRMLPENGRKWSNLDAQHAYHWILNNGPDGRKPLEYLLVSGDSAGGNLALMVSGWSKRNASRRPDAVVALSPSTDMTLCSPTIKTNQKTDKLLGESLGLLSKLPSPIRAWMALLSLRMNPANELASPLFGDLSDLPPTLIHASSNEVLLGESIRYTNRALAMGSEVTLQIWKDQIHDWHLFNMGYGSANVAWDEIARFLNSPETKQIENKQQSAA
jgi:acetyl esterase/lipase